MTVLFLGDMETGNLAQFTILSTPTAPTASVASARSGSYGMHIQTLGTGIPASDTLENVWARKDVSPSSYNFWAQCWFRLNTPLTGENHRIVIMSMTAQGGSLGSCGVQVSGGSMKWYVIKSTRPMATTGPVVGQWYLLEFHVDNNTGGILELFVDGQQVVYSNDGSGYNYDGVRFGASANTTYSISADIDDCRIGDAYIGPPPTTNPRITINSSPEIGAPVYVDGVSVGVTPVIVEVLPGQHTVQVDQEVLR